MHEDEKTDASLRTVLDVFCGRHPNGFRALAEISRPDFWFRDPFVEVHGFDNFKNFLRESSAHRTDTQWLVAGSAVSGRSGYVRWRYMAAYTDGTSLAFDGMTEFGFDEEGRVAFQIDFWDSAEALTVKVPSLREPIVAAKADLHV